MNVYERAFLDSILAAPDDDAPRLIFADWLEESGQAERSEFIRVQCKLVVLNLELLSNEDCESPDCLGCRERRDLQKREGELLHAHWIEWSSVMGGAGYCMNLYSGKPFSPPNRAITFRRGFVECLMCPADDWIHHADDLVRVTPLREVELTTMPQYVVRYGSQVEIFGIEDIVRENFERDLKTRWPYIRFTLPPAPSATAATVLRHNDGTIFELTGNDRDIQVGDYVVQDGHGRLVRTDSRAGAAGIALSRMDANGMVRVRLVDDSTMQLHQNAAEAQRLRQMMERPFAGPLVDLDLDEPPH